MDNRVDRQAYLVSNQPFTTADALSAGWSEGELRRAVRDGGLVRLRRGVLIAAAAHRELQGAQLHRLLVQAELLALESPAAASHASAAFVYGMPLLTEPSEVELTSAVADARRRPGLVLRRSPLIEAHLGSDAYGLPVTSPARTVVDVARTRPIRDALVVADAALRLRLATKDELEEVLEAARTWPGAPRARRVCRLADAGAESPGETLLRLDLLELGLVRFRLQVVVRGASGRRYRADVLLEDLGVIVEFDGELKYDGPGGRDALKAEKRREDDLRLAGWAVVRVSWSELGDRDRLRRKLQQATRLSHRRTAAS